MRRMVVVAALGVIALAAAPGKASAGSFELRGGWFFPRAESNLFDDTNELFGVDKGDWSSFTGGTEYSFNVSDHIEVGLHIDFYDRTLDTTYRDFTRPNGQEIFQTLKLESLPVGASVRFVLNPSRGAFTPYVAVGPDVVFYEYKEFGDFINFFDDSLPVSGDSFFDDGAAFGVHAAVGLRFPLGDDFSLTAEGRYLWAKTDMGQDFRLNEIDLSGPSATIGLHLRF